MVVTGEWEGVTHVFESDRLDFLVDNEAVELLAVVHVFREVVQNLRELRHIIKTNVVH